VCGDDRIRDIREQTMLQVDLVRRRAEARLDLGYFIMDLCFYDFKSFENSYVIRL